MKKLQIIYSAVVAVTALLALLGESEVLPSDYIANDASVLYYVNLYSIVIAFGVTFLSLRMFVFKMVTKAVSQPDEARALAAFEKWSVVRIGALALALWSNLLLYYATSYTTTPQYCFLITLVACVFCWPSRSAFSALREKSAEKKEEGFFGNHQQK